MPIKKTIAGFFVATAFSGAVLASEPTPAALEEAPTASMFERYSDSIRSLVDRSLNFLGVPYRFGGTSPITGFDCSGFVGKVFADALGFGMPRTAAEMAQMGEQVKINELKPGDLVFFNTRNKPFSHVGVYIGGQRFVHAPSSNGRVRIDSLSARYYAQRFEAARTYFD